MAPNGGVASSSKAVATTTMDALSPASASPPSQKTRLLFMGLKRSGKSSIVNVVLYKLPPTETVFIPTTVVIKKHTLYSFRNFQVWDLPGQIDFLETNFDTDSIFHAAGAMVWVLDSQDDYLESIARFTEAVLQLTQLHPDLRFAVFIHKVDSLSSDYRDDTIRDVVQRILDDLNDAGLDNPPVSFYPTSVYDDSIYEALSKVLQRLIGPQLDSFEAMLTTVAAACRMQKLYLFDVLSKLYVASDASPVDMAGYSLCSDYIDTIVDLSEIYGWDRGGPRIDGAVSPLLMEGEGDEPNIVEADNAKEGEMAAKEEEGHAESFISGVRGCCLYLKEMNKFLALIGFSEEPRFAEEKPLVDYNVQIFQDALAKVLALN